MVEKVEKSSRDPRDYECLTLSNSIKCIVISDPDTEVAAAAMNIHVGSLHEDLPGLAHYLEHMLFMGTEKFPEENEFSNFLSDNAGSSNAFTDYENTNFYFKVSSDQIHSALDIFAQFFIAPLFKEDSLERELKAIDSEFDKNHLDEYWRIQQIILNNAGSPINHFGHGNSSTLKIPGIRDRIIEFYNKHYSANLMSLVIYAKESTETLRQWAEDLFSPIKNKNVQLPTYTKPEFSKSPTITKVIPVKDNKNLRFLWVLPSFIEKYEEKPEGYIGHLLGHEGKNSLLSILKKFNLAEELTCYHEELFTFCSHMSVDVKLTEKGLTNYTTVADIVWGYLDFLKTQEPKDYLYYELRQVAEAEFLFKSKKDPYWFCQKLSSRLERYPPTKVLTAAELYFKFDAELISSVFKMLSLDNLQLILVSKTLDKTHMKEEMYFGAQYLTEPLPETLIQALKNPNLSPYNVVLELPLANPYIPENYNLLGLSEEKIPKRLLSDHRQTIWFKQDSQYSIDKVHGQLVIYCNSFGFDTSSYSFMLAKMWEKMLCEKVREESYLAELAGLKHEIDVDNHGLRVSLSGFSQKYAKFFEFLVSQVAQYVPNLEDIKLFTDLKNEFVNMLTNCFFSKPTTQIQRMTYELNLHGGYFTQIEKLKALVSIELEDLVWFSHKWLKNVHFEWFLMGNLTEATALTIAETCMTRFIEAKNPVFLGENEFVIGRIAKIPRGIEMYEEKLTDENNTNSAVVVQVQLGPETPEDECLIYLVENYIEEPFFDILRTKEQLGYIVSSYSQKLRGILNFMFLIQSSTHPPSHLFTRINAFLMTTYEDFKNLTDKQFSKLKKSTKESTMKKDLSLQEEFHRYKYEIDSAALNFLRKKKLKETLVGISKEQLVEFFRKSFVENTRVLKISLISKNFVEADKETKGQQKLYTGLSEFRRAHGLWEQVNVRKIYKE